MRIIWSGLLTITLASGCAGTPSIDGGGTPQTLEPCPASPNCVSSLAQDEMHAIEPFRYETGTEAARKALLEALSATPRVTVTVETNRYIHAEARTRLFRFVDDLEFLFDEDEATIHIRSASRVGYGDMGVNRKRLESIRERFLEAISNR